MNPNYVKDVLRFGGSAPFTDEDGKSFNLSHRDDIDPGLVKTDGEGDVTCVPLVWRKPCFGRLERYARAGVGGRPWLDDNGVRRLGRTTCDSCRDQSPGTYEVCSRIVDERVNSNPAIRAALDKWLDACVNQYGPQCFVGRRMILWQSFLQAIIDAGGWSNVNDDQVKLEALRLERKRKADRKARRQAASRQRRAVRSGKVITPDYEQKLAAERDRRCAHLKSLRVLSGRTKREMCGLAWKRDPGSGVIGVEKGPLIPVV